MNDAKKQIRKSLKYFREQRLMFGELNNIENKRRLATRSKRSRKSTMMKEQNNYNEGYYLGISTGLQLALDIIKLEERGRL